MRAQVVYGDDPAGVTIDLSRHADAPARWRANRCERGRGYFTALWQRGSSRSKRNIRFAGSWRARMPRARSRAWRMFKKRRAPALSGCNRLTTSNATSFADKNDLEEPLGAAEKSRGACRRRGAREGSPIACARSISRGRSHEPRRRRDAIRRRRVCDRAARVKSAPLDLTEHDFDQLAIVSPGIEARAREAQKQAQLAVVAAHTVKPTLQTKAAPPAGTAYGTRAVRL